MSCLPVEPRPGKGAQGQSMELRRDSKPSSGHSSPLYSFSLLVGYIQYSWSGETEAQPAFQLWRLALPTNHTILDYYFPRLTQHTEAPDPHVSGSLHTLGEAIYQKEVCFAFPAWW